MNKQEYIKSSEENILHTYNRFPIVLDKGEGVYLYDIEGKKYLDFAAGIAVFSLGYHYKGFDEVIKHQVDKLIHTSNLFYNVPAIEAAEKIKRISGMEKVFFTNSGTEAIEGAIKLAKKFGKEKGGERCFEIIAMKHSFHGRSLGALSITGNEAYRNDFMPLIEGVKFAIYNDLESVKNQITENTCAIILETLQGEGGIYEATKEFIQGIRTLCNENNILLILDEIQCGMGRTGKMFCYEHYGIKPDIVTVAKALGGGVPIGAFLCNKKAETMTIGDHGSTYGGNPLVCSAASKVLDIFKEDNILDNVNVVGTYLKEKLEQLAEEKDCIIECRGKGLMLGLELNISPAPIIKKALEEGLIIISAGKNVLRFVPPLIIKKEHVDEMIAILKKIL